MPTVLSLGNVNMSGKKKADSDEKPTPITKPPLVAPPVIAAPPSGSLACSVSGASPNAFRINVGGESISSAAMGADNMAYITSTDKGNLQSKSSLSISAAKGPATWDMAYSSHRWTTASVLKYNIPVLPGMYTVKLLFAEVVFSKPGQRTFDVFINGATKDTNLDVVKLTGKKNVGLVQTYKDVPAKTGVIEVTLVKSIENPMLSGIIIEGMGADAVAVGGGCIAGGPKPKKGDLNDGFDHRSHSVPGGPYMATDFDKSGRASVSLDGTQSHSHYSDPGPPEVSGKIVAYKWTWTEIAGGSTLKKVNTNKSGKFTASFPLGKTTVSLEVVDSTGDVATDTVVVEVKVSTQNGAYCYYYDFGDKTFSSVPIGKLLNSNPKPQFGSQQSTVDFNGQKDFADVPFVKNSFAVRCVFYINIPSNGAYAYTVHHNGPFQLYHGPTLLSQAQSKGKTTSQTFNFKGGLNQFQLIYFRPKNLPPLLVLSSKGNTLSSSALQHDSAATLPVIVGLSKATSAPSGGQNIQIFGSGFINGVAVKFGDVEATNLMSSSTGVVQVTVPPGSGEVFITVSTNAGMSNAFKFTYLSATTLQQPVIFKQEKLMDASGGVYKISFVSTATYGPDGRLYLGTTNEKLIALGINSKFVVTSKCERLTGKSRSVLGVAFSPFSKSLKMYFTTSSLYWKDKNIFNFEQGWNNGKIQSIEFSSKHVSDGPGQSCAGDIKDVVTGLPVSNHDHGLSKLQFLPDGSLIVGVGGFTNGGVSVPGNKPVPNDPKDDKLGGVSSNPLSAALVSCPYNKVTKIVYDQYSNPEKAKIVSPGACKVYASGFRNSFGMTVHTNGNLYATDNGPNASFGDFSTNCNGGKKPGKNAPDKLFLVQKGKFHGHPNINRKECQHYPPSAVQPIVGNFKSSSNGVIEYRSNTFGGDIKGNLYVAKFAGQHAGQVAQVKFGKDGGKSNVNVVPVFIPFSGLTIIEGPRGELVMPRVYQSEIVIAYPSYPAPDVTFLIGVHPKQGPASGGSRVLVSGHNFGSSPKATFGGSKCTNVIVIDDDSFSCLTPPKPKNTLVPVIVTGSAGVSPSYGSDFWYF